MLMNFCIWINDEINVGIFTEVKKMLYLADLIDIYAKKWKIWAFL